MNLIDRLKPLWVAATLLTLTACMSPSPNMIRVTQDMIDQNQTAVVVVRINGKGPGLFGAGENDRSLFTAIREVAAQGHFYSWNKYDDVRVLHVKPGTYQFHSFTYGAQPMVFEPLPELEYDPNIHIPVRPFTVKAGEVVYLGTLYVNGVYHEKPIYAGDKKASYRVEDETEAGRAALETALPGQGSQMVTRLLVVDTPTKDAGNFVE